MNRRLPSLLLAAFAGIYLWQALAIPLDPWSASESINARTLPITYAVLLLLVALGLGIRPAPSSETGSIHSALGWRRLASHAVVIVAFGLFIPLAGLWVSLAGLLLACLLIAGERRPLVLVLAPLGTALLAWFLLVVALGVYIDPGRWFS